MSIFEYDEEKHMRQTREEGWEDGMKEGQVISRRETVLELLEDLGDIPAEIKDMVEKQDNLEVLKQWHKMAAKADNLEEFRDKMSSTELLSSAALFQHEI